ncbi:MAG: hypothetical protein J6Y02_06135 [Pseudobutyrivibrio sp.]|nr:hypothetical protein [Pseudobutyrivibrio sp.]
MTKNNLNMLMVLFIWGALIKVMDAIFTLEWQLDITNVIVASISLGILIVVYIHAFIVDDSWFVFEIDLLIGTVAFTAIYFVSVLCEIDLLGLSKWVFYVIIAIYIGMMFLGIYTFIIFKYNKDQNVRGNKRTAVGAAIITPLIALYYIIYKNVIKDKHEELFILTWLIISIFITGFFIWIATIMILETYVKIKMRSEK